MGEWKISLMSIAQKISKSNKILKGKKVYVKKL